MTAHRTLLRVEQLGSRVLPSATATPMPTAAAAVAAPLSTTVTTGSAWTGQGRYTIATNATTAVKTYTLDVSASVGSLGFFAVKGSIATVGNKSGQATGRLVLTSPRGTLTLTLTGPTQAARSGLPASFTYKVAGVTGVFAKYAGQGTLKLSTDLFPGYTDRGHVSLSATAPTAPPVTQPPGSTTAGSSWQGQGRFTIAVNRTTGVKTYALEGSANFGAAGYFAIAGSIQTVGAAASGQATGRITLSDPRGTLVLAVTGPTQARGSGLPTTLTYRVVSGTGFFARYAGQGTVQISVQLFAGYSDKGHFEVAVRPAAK